jgi:hypothetical protein
MILHLDGVEQCNLFLELRLVVVHAGDHGRQGPRGKREEEDAYDHEEDAEKPLPIIIRGNVSIADGEDGGDREIHCCHVQVEHIVVSVATFIDPIIL